MEIIELLEKELLINRTKLLNFIFTAPHRYKKYEINKRNGKGVRLIAHPSKELKYIQRFITKYLNDILSVHQSAFAYRKSIGIKDNAVMHKNSSYLLKMDFKDFFPSITPKMFFNVTGEKGLKFSEIDKLVLENILFYRKYRNSNLRLSIGAPSSPLISNFVMNLFDESITNFCEKNNIVYTRYADDLVFSTNTKKLLFEVPAKVNVLLKKHCFGFITINNNKTIFSSKAHNRFITGITITNSGEISLGRSRKRMISSLVHKFKLGLLDEDMILKLRGYLSFSKSIEPSFISRLCRKYGSGIIKEIFTCNLE